MTKRHIHADVIHAWAEGEDIQIKVDGEWLTLPTGKLISDGIFYPSSEYRIKPKKVKKEGWVNVYSERVVYGSYTTKELADRHAGPYRKACVRIEWEEEE